MRYLSDGVIGHLRGVAEWPDLSHTKYRCIRKIASGGMGTVFLVEDAHLGRQVALKVMDVSDPGGSLAERMRQEARVLAQLEHPGIVPVHDLGVLQDGRVFYTMKLVKGLRLDHAMENITLLPERLRLFQKVCDAVAFAHAHGVVLGLVVGLVLAYFVAPAQQKYYLEIMVPGSLVGLILGYATQRYGKAREATARS